MGGPPRYNFDASGNPNLACIQVDDSANSTEFWTKDPTAVFSIDCSKIGGGSSNIITQEAKQIMVYPNPTNGKLTIDNQGKAIKSITVLNLMGSKVLEVKLNKNTYDVSTLTTGMFILEVQFENSIGYSRFVKN